MDRDKRRSYNRRQRGQEQRLLAQIARGDTAQNVLCVLCASVESSIGRGVRCAVHLPDGDGARIVQVIAPSFEGYFQRRGPVAIDPTGGSSAAAAYLRRQIVLGQIDNNTSVLKSADTLFTGHGMRAICATPVLSRGSVLAVVSVYYVQPGVPSREDQQVIEWATRIASIVLGHERAVYALTQSETKYRSFLDHLRDGVFITQEGIVVYANPAITELTGRAAQDLLGSDFHAMLATEDAAMLRSLEAMHLSGARAPNECTLRIVRADGDLRTMRINQAAITWNDAPASLSTLTDITERQRAEQEVRRLNAELERRVGERTRELAAVNRELEAFSYSVSHDLRAPVRAINGFSAMLLNKHAGALDADARLHLERVYGAGQRMDEMIEGLLALARIARAAPRFGTVGMSEIARRVLAQLRETQSGRVVECDIADDISVWGDARLLRTVLENLLGNAWKFTGKNKQARLAFGVTVRDGERVFYVQDNGAGFDMRYADKLFGVFSRLHRNDEFDGTGIGLATVQRIIACHGGRIWAEAEAGRGATFFFTLGQPTATNDAGAGALSDGNARALVPRGDGKASVPDLVAMLPSPEISPPGGRPKPHENDIPSKAIRIVSAHPE